MEWINRIFGRKESNSSHARRDDVDTTKKTVVPSSSSLSFWLCDDPVYNFTGREKDLDKIHNVLKECCNKEDWSERTIVLHGIGGIGKSELVRQYVKNQEKTAAKRKLFESVAWINANTRESATKSFTELAEKLKFLQGRNLESLAKNFYKYYFENYKKIKTCLLIFDNVEQNKDEKSGFKILNVLPGESLFESKPPLILITSRYGKWNLSTPQIIIVKELSCKESVEFFKNEFLVRENQKQQQNYKETLNAIYNLSEEIHGIPYALSLAATNINKNKSTTNLIHEIQNYITDLNVINTGLINQQNTCEPVVGNDKLTMSDVWDSTFIEIKSTGSEGEYVLKLLGLLSYLPINFLIEVRIEEIAKFCFGDDKNFSQRFKTLETYSFITRISKKNADEDRIEINPHVQRCIREKLDSCDNFSYLFAICLFFCQQDIHSFYESNRIILAMHNLLKQRNWPHDSISLSIRFISHSVKDGDFQIFKDVNEWLKTQNNSNILSNTISVLLNVWRFYFSLEKEYSGEAEFPGSFFDISYLHASCVTFTELFVDELKLLLDGDGRRKSIGQSFGRVVDLNESPLYLRDRLEFLEIAPTTLAENNSSLNFSFPVIQFKRPLKKEEGNRALFDNDNLLKDEESDLESCTQDSLLLHFKVSPPALVGIKFTANRWFKLMDHCFIELNADGKEKICKVVLSALESSPTDSGIGDTVRKIELFSKCIRTIGFDSRSVRWFFNAVITKHLKFYPDQSNRPTFWSMHFCLYETIVGCWDKFDAKSRERVADTFFSAGGLQLLIHHLHKLHSSSSFTTQSQIDSFSKNLFDLFGSIVLLANTAIGAERFVETKDFLTILSKVIKSAFLLDDNKIFHIDINGKFLCLLSWLAFFDENETFLRTPEPKWLLDFFKIELDFFEKDLKQETGARLENTLAKAAVEIISKVLLSEFHEFYEIANGLYNYLQSIGDPKILAFHETEQEERLEEFPTTKSSTRIGV